MTESGNAIVPTHRRAARIWLARGVAVAVDVLQIAIFPATAVGAQLPVNDVVDVIACVVLTLLVGWNIAFLPSFVIKLLPLADVAPTWTLAVLFATRRRQ
ncbi:MAG: hypothetical protein JO353_10045 [Phycisphaerae bacterium]|nr:hypothetical protein [Phycisphaerae bacterium]